MISAPRALPFLLLIALGCRERDMGWPRTDFAPNVEYGPQLACATPDSIRVSWRTLGHVRGAVEFRRAGALDWIRVDGEPEPGRDHDIRIQGLVPGEPYEYRLLHDSLPVGGPYRIRPRDRGEATFVVFGDSGSGGAEQRAITRRIAEADPEFVLHTGDLAYDFGTRREALRRFFVPYAPLLATRPWYVAWGNHDCMTDDGKALREMIRLPGSRYYSFDRGDTRFYALDTNLDFRRGSRQYEWLMADIAESPGKRRVAFFHYPPYSASPYADTFPATTRALREDLCPVFEQHGFEIVFSGHVHGYERAQPKPGKPVYIVTGGGGKRLNDPGVAAWTQRYAQVWHICVVTMTSSGFVVRAINEEGEEFDRYPPLPGS